MMPNAGLPEPLAAALIMRAPLGMKPAARRQPQSDNPAKAKLPNPLAAALSGLRPKGYTLESNSRWVFRQANGRSNDANVVVGRLTHRLARSFSAINQVNLEFGS